jgi:hypothetical protein
VEAAVASKFNALVRFDVLGREVGVTVGGSVPADALDEICQVIERSVDIAGKPAAVDLSDTEVTDDTLGRIRERCQDIADITGPERSAHDGHARRTDDPD